MIFLVLMVKKLDTSVALIFGTHVKFLDFLFLNKFTIVLLALSLLSLTISFSSALNVFGANSLNNLVVFNKKVNNAAILLKLWMKRQ